MAGLSSAWREHTSTRGLLLGAALLLGVSLWAPLWATRMEAPQYHGDETLEVRVYAGRVQGDVHEIQTLNQYVGVHLPLDTPELHASPWILGALLAAALIAALAPAKMRRGAAAIIAVALVLVALGGAADLQYRLWQMGHVRDHPIFEGVPDFTPPILGSRKIANFTVHTGLRLGGWAYALAALLAFGAAWQRRRPEPAGNAEAEDAGPEVSPPPGDPDAVRAGVPEARSRFQPMQAGEPAGGGQPDAKQSNGGPPEGRPPGAPPGEESASKRPWALLGAGVAIVLLLALFVGGLVLIPRYQAAHPFSDLQRSDADQVRLDDLFLDVTLVTPEFRRSRDLDRYLGDRDPDSVIPVLVGLNTHTGDIGHMHRLPGHLEMIDPAGNRYPALTEPIVLSQHHNAYMLLFPARGQDGTRLLEGATGTLAIEALEMGHTPVRRFEWKLPLDTAVVSTGQWASRLMLVVALLAALLVVLSPCALELTLYYTAIISCTVTDAEAALGAAPEDRLARAGRRRILTNLGSFVAGFTLLYALSGATVGLIGAGVRQPLGAWSETIQVLGGLLILMFAARVAGLHTWLRSKMPGAGAAPALRAQPRGLMGLLARWRMRAQQRARTMGMRPRDSFLVGMGLSSACLSCMGGAVLYPLLVYAGITSWQSGLITLGLYSLFIAVPMVFIALGFFRLRMSLHRRMRMNQVLRYASAFMLAGIGALILSGNERLVGDLVFRLLASVAAGSS